MLIEHSAVLHCFLLNPHLYKSQLHCKKPTSEIHAFTKLHRGEDAASSSTANAVPYVLGSNSTCVCSLRVFTFIPTKRKM